MCRCRCGGRASTLQTQPYEHRARGGDQPQLQPQPAGRLAPAKPGERAGQRDAQADPGVDPGAQLRGLPPGQFGQAPAARADQRPGTEDAGGGAQHGTDEGRRLPVGPRRGQRRQRNAERASRRPRRGSLENQEAVRAPTR